MVEPIDHAIALQSETNFSTEKARPTSISSSSADIAWPCHRGALKAKVPVAMFFVRNFFFALGFCFASRDHSCLGFLLRKAFFLATEFTFSQEYTG